MLIVVKVLPHRSHASVMSQRPFFLFIYELKVIMADVFYYVQHLLGIGHVRRSVAIANSLARHDMRVHFVGGGNPVPDLGLDSNIEFSQLPPIRARDGDFSDLVDEHDTPVDEKWWKSRRERLLSLWMQSQAPILITESFPFARYMMRHELIPLLEETRRQSFSRINICSVRDIPQPKRKSERAGQIIDILDRYYDRILVHGDRKIATLDETFPEVVSDCGNIAIEYTGYVDNNSSISDSSVPASDVLVSTGGGATGLPIYQASIEAARSDTSRQWRLLIGPNVEDGVFSSLRASAVENVIVERNRHDFRAVLQAASVSVSQGGYNTTVDLLRTQVPAVLIPYAKGGEVEQASRAEKFAAFGHAVVLDENELSSTTLLEALDEARQVYSDSAKPGSDTNAVDTLMIDGADQSARLIRQWLHDL